MIVTTAAADAVPAAAVKLGASLPTADAPALSNVVKLHPHGGFNGAEIVGTLDLGVLASRRVTWSSSRKGVRTPPGGWSTTEGTLLDFMGKVATKHAPAASKDGPMIACGALASGVRKASAVTGVDFLCLDFDGGAHLDTIVGKVRDAGVLAICHSTYSHLKTTSKVRRDHLAKELGEGVEPTAADVAGYLQRTKGMRPDLLEGAILELETEHGADGVCYVMHHRPVEKFRVIFPLAATFTPSKAADTDKAAADLWRRRYEAVAGTYGAGQHDPSCADLARAFYAPSHPKGTDTHRTVIVAGTLLDLDTFTPVVDGDRFTQVAKAMGGAGAGSYQTARLAKFAARFGDVFEIEEFLETHDWTPRGGRSSGAGHHYRCPNDAAHSDPDNGEDRGFVAINGTDSENGFAAWCMHSHCKTMDRLALLDLACQEVGIVDAAELLEFCPEIEGRPHTLDDAADGDGGFADHADALAAVNALEKGDAMGAGEVARAIGGMLAFDPAVMDGLLTAIKDRTGVGKRALQAVAKAEAETARQVRQERARDAGEADAAAARQEGRFVWPDGFKVQGGRLGYMRDGGDNGPVFAPVCDVFTPRGVERGEDGAGFALLLDFTDRTGRAREESILLRDVAQNAGEVIGRLADAGLGFVAKREAKDKLAECLAALQVPNVITKVSRPGWREADDGRPVFICPRGEVIGSGGGDRDAIPGSTRDTTREAFRLAAGAGAKDADTAGTLDGWKQAAAAAFETPENYHWPVGVLAGFAGTLVQLAGLDTCGVNLSGRTSKGKTTAQALAASVWANPKAGQGVLATFRSTANALEGLAKAATGTVLALDELGQADPRQVGQALFMLAGGAGKVRMSRDLVTRAPATFSTFAILSGEQGLRAVIEGARDTYAAGMAVRFPDVDVTDTRDVTPGEFAAVNACRANYGHAGAVFVRHLIAAGLADDAGGLRGSIDALAGEIAGEGAAAPTRRAAVPFAIMRRAGEVAIEAGLLPPDADVAGTVGRAWSAYLGGSEAEMLDGGAVAIDRLRTALHTGWDTTVLDTAAGANYGSYRGPRAWYNEALGSVYIPVDNLREFTGQGFKAAAVLKDLAAEGWLQKQGPSRSWTVIPKMGKVRHYRLSYGEFAPNKDREG